MTLPRQPYAAGYLSRGAVRGRGAGSAWPLAAAAWGPQRSPGSRPARRAVAAGDARAALRPEGRPGVVPLPGVLPAPPPVPPPGPAQRPPGPQAGRQLPAQRPPPLHVQRLVDRLVRHLHLRPARELRPQPGADLLRRPAPRQLGLHQGTQLPAARELSPLRPPRPLLRQRPRPPRPAPLPRPVPRHLPAD